MCRFGGGILFTRIRKSTATFKCVETLNPDPRTPGHCSADRCVSVFRCRECRNLYDGVYVLLSFQGAYNNTRSRFSSGHFQCCSSSSSRRLSLHPASKNRTAAPSPLSSIPSRSSEISRKGIPTCNLHSRCSLVDFTFAIVLSSDLSYEALEVRLHFEKLDVSSRLRSIFLLQR